jgi:hypothetical protein
MGYKMISVKIIERILKLRRRVSKIEFELQRMYGRGQCFIASALFL